MAASAYALLLESSEVIIGALTDTNQETPVLKVRPRERHSEDV